MIMTQSTRRFLSINRSAILCGLELPQLFSGHFTARYGVGLLQRNCNSGVAPNLASGKGGRSDSPRLGRNFKGGRGCFISARPICVSEVLWHQRATQQISNT
jgi:hypothetical protein